MTSVSETGSIEFSFYRPGASEVKVAGTFNQWAGVEMIDVGDGWWKATVDLTAGDYRFRYVADGNWFTDFAANGVELTKRGWNSILTVAEMVSEPRMRIEPAAEQNMTDAIAA